MQEAQQLCKFGFQGNDIDVIKDGDTLWVSVRRVCEALGLDAKSQRRKLQEKEWATGVMMTSVDPNGRNREHFMIDLDSFPMWLATIETSRVAEHVRPKLIAYQKEAAKALRDYFFGGYAINERLIDMTIKRNQAAISCIHMLSTGPLFSKEYLQNKAEHLLAEICGTEPVPEYRLIDVGAYLKGKGLSEREVMMCGAEFGKNVRDLYINRYGEPPRKGDRFVNGSNRPVNIYTEKDLDLFEKAYERMFQESPQLELIN